jgi:hypothetical protein
LPSSLSEFSIPEGEGWSLSRMTGISAFLGHISQKIRLWKWTRKQSDYAPKDGFFKDRENLSAQSDLRSNQKF